MVLIRKKYLSPIAGMKDSFKTKFPLDRKKLSPEGASERIYKKWFVLARKCISTTQNDAFIEKYVSSMRKNASSGNKKSKKMVSTGRKMIFF